jgi:hypothetical protein
MMGDMFLNAADGAHEEAIASLTAQLREMTAQRNGLLRQNEILVAALWDAEGEIARAFGNLQDIRKASIASQKDQSNAGK